MPKRNDLKKIMIIGSGPIVIGQACEFDYSGSQACKSLKEEGYNIVLVNSNPATIMTDPEMADATYLEPLTVDVLAKIIEKEMPCALLPTLGGQTGLNLATFLAKEGVLARYGVEVIGADIDAIAMAEDRELFKKAMIEIGLKVPESVLAYNLQEGIEIGNRLGFPLVLRPAYTLGGTGGSIAYNMEEFEKKLDFALETSPIHEVLIEQSVLGWKEIEFEVMHDTDDNAIIVTSMENIDPMGMHTGDSIVVAPAQTLSTPEYENLVDLSKRVIRKIGVNGGANIQYAVNPLNGDVVIIEVNPRVSRSSALASKATGFPIARIATKLSVGYTLDEIKNQITGKTTCFAEPTVDYCVFKIPRFTFEKFPGADTTITTSMKAVGEAMSIGRNFREALQKGIRSLEIGRYGLGSDKKDRWHIDHKFTEEEKEFIVRKITIPDDERIFYIRYAILAGFSISEIYKRSAVDPWFLYNIKQIVDMEKELCRYKLNTLPSELLTKAKRSGFSDRQLAFIFGCDEKSIREMRNKKNITAVFKPVDSVAGEFQAEKPYYYSTFEKTDVVPSTNKKKVVILGGGPNRIGQGIEFDYCCVHASFALREENYESIMVNCNPETVSTDYDTSDRLYFEPITIEDVLNVVERERPEGVILQFGGQTPLNLAISLQNEGVRILGTSPETIDIAEDRKKFKTYLEKLSLKQPPNGTATSFREAEDIADRIGYPVLVRPSYVLGGRAMEIVYDRTSLEAFMQRAVDVSSERPVLIDKFLEDAIEVDVDAICDGTLCVIGGIMEHIEEAGVHSGDSAMVLPPYSLDKKIIEEITAATKKLALELHIKGLINIQYAVKGKTVYILEVNPRASRTVPFVSKVIDVPLAKLATKIMIGKTLKELGFTEEVSVKYFAVKESVFPFIRFPGVDTVLGPEMKSTGEVIGIDTTFEMAYAKSQIAAGQKLPLSGSVFISVKDRDKKVVLPIAKGFYELGFKILASAGTGKLLKENGIEATIVPKIYEAERPNVLDYIKNNQISLIINTPSGKKPKKDITSIRSIAVGRNIPLITTIPGAKATLVAIKKLKENEISVKSIQEYHAHAKGGE
ncbi:MAG: carbamoyl-phosphate synthase large subunit [Candidatus Ratteibacteria bacterium]|nr:carbamoyl-phosphate synthase large subunit [Candidatus Ratteibacteria bacterium]